MNINSEFDSLFKTIILSVLGFQCNFHYHTYVIYFIFKGSREATLHSCRHLLTNSANSLRKVSVNCSSIQPQI